MFLSSAFLVALIVRPERQSPNLDAWFIKDKNQQSCASCHSVDGIELRNFRAADVQRRTARHHEGQTAAAVAQIIQANAAPSGEIGTEIRPMQPGGSVLKGSTPIERDAKFLFSIKKKFPELFVPVTSLKDALALHKAILSINLGEVPIGILMNRLSEDGSHGDEHRTIANWFPDVPTFDSSEMRNQLESYRSNPTIAALDALDKKVVELAKPTDPFASLSLAKYRALMVYQHELRTHQTSTYLPIGNPFWQIADFARIYPEADSVAVRVPSEIAEAKRMSTTFKDQLKQLRLPWFWLGWIHDPSLTQSGGSKETVRGDYFSRFLEEDGPYLAHEIFMLTRKLSEQTRMPLFPNYPFEIQYSFFLTNTPLVKREPKDVKARDLFRQFTVNSFRMSLYILENDLTKTSRAIRKVPQANQIGYIRQYGNVAGTFNCLRYFALILQ